MKPNPPDIGFLFQLHERLQDIEHRALEKIANLETELIQVRQERDELVEVKKKADEEVSTLRRVVQHHEQESKHRQSMFESKMAALDTTGSLPKGASSKSAENLIWNISVLWNISALWNISVLRNISVLWEVK